MLLHNRSLPVKLLHDPVLFFRTYDLNEPVAFQFLQVIMHFRGRKGRELLACVFLLDQHRDDL
ncbi:hypothetical protein BP422_16425 [Brevibacillus formosus]|uniref:Uncharacterized protein n=1 Tax=Brevibacillus formosus TaxID=54913 RepID=A0A220MIT9_9BACL|nr:hypothetical protein BP422_16425 [Brevibacillus formosus]